MSELKLASVERLDVFLNELLESGVLTDQRQSILRLRYGVGGQTPRTVKEISKAIGMKPKILIKEIEEVDRAIFNFLKSRI